MTGIIARSYIVPFHIMTSCLVCSFLHIARSNTNDLRSQKVVSLGSLSREQTGETHPPSSKRSSRGMADSDAEYMYISEDPGDGPDGKALVPVF